MCGQRLDGLTVPPVHLQLAVEARDRAVRHEAVVGVADEEALQRLAPVIGQRDDQGFPIGPVLSAEVEAVDQAAARGGLAEDRLPGDLPQREFQNRRLPLNLGRLGLDRARERPDDCAEHAEGDDVEDFRDAAGH